MAKVRDPIRFSEQFGIDTDAMTEAGVLDPTLNIDTRLFIDPLLLANSAQPEISKGARATYEKHFATIIKFLSRSAANGDVAWRSAQKLLSFPEIKWTCLGFGAASVSGSGSGAEMTGQYIETARQIVALGIDDPDLFVAMALFEEGVGPDRISDMTTNVILGDLLKFNERVLKELGVSGQKTRIELRNGATFEAILAHNPCLGDGEPVILVPADVLRKLPVATDWSEIADAASKNQQLRRRVNRQIAKLWEVRSRKDKAKLRQWALSGKDEFETFLEMVRGADAEPYDLDADPLGELFWRNIAASIAEQIPLKIEQPQVMDLAAVVSVMDQIIEQFRFLIEDRRLSEELYHDGSPRPEKAAQRLFFAVAHAYCKANNLDITPEADTGNGPVDFKVSKGFVGRALVEIKLSRNQKLIDGYTRQLETYKKAEETVIGYYLVIDVGNMGKKAEKLLAIKNRRGSTGNFVSRIEFVDGKRRNSASKLTRLY